MASGASVKFDLNKKLLKELQTFVDGNMYVKIGVLNDAKRPDGFGAAELAAVHEFGSATQNIPKRSFLLKTMLNKRNEFQDLVIKNLSKMELSIVKNGARKFLEKVGAQWVAYVIDTFDAEGPGWKPLAPFTVAMRNKKHKKSGAKGPASHKILQDTGAMKRSITYEVVEK